MQTPSGTTATTTTATNVTAQLLPSKVIPPVTGGESGGSGTVTITLHVTKDASGKTTTATADFHATVNGFPVDSLFTAAHVHRGDAACSAPCPVVIDTTAITAPGVLFATRSGSIDKLGVTVNPATLADELLSNPSAFYFDVHTASNQNGVARGQLAK
ncbi:MAG: CHRD domain-containing protein [Burkholderiales bacterium]